MQPVDPEPSVENPFDPDRAVSDESLRRPLLLGCGSGCSVLLFLGVVLLVVLGAKSGELVGWALRVSEDTLSSAAPADWSEEDGRRLSEAYRSAAAALATEDVEAEDVLALNRSLTDCLRRAASATLTRDDLLELEGSLRRVAGEASPSEDRGRRAWWPPREARYAGV